jgi:hypothetical protein
MKTKFFAGAVGAALVIAAMAAIGTTALVATTAPAFASNDPIPGIDVVVRKHPSGAHIQTKTDAHGTFKLGDLAPGAYTIELQSFSWGVSTGKLDPNGKAVLRIVQIVIEAAPSETPVVSSRQTVSPGRSVSIPFTIPDTKGAPRNHTYHGTVTLLK